MGNKMLVSGCLAGILCKYDGTCNTVPEIKQLVVEGRAIPVCPEVQGGAPVPREPCETVGGDGNAVLDGRARVLTTSGRDCTDIFVRGAEEVLKKALDYGVKVAILKERSPSCGSSFIYDGTFSGVKIHGCGVAAALLLRSGIKVYSENNFSEKFRLK